MEHHWIAGEHVDWQTGLPDGKAERLPGKHTHCSAFVASAAEALDVYILRPPEHGQVLLANAQNEWVASPMATAAGWRRLNDAQEAQAAPTADSSWLRAATIIVTTFPDTSPSCGRAKNQIRKLLKKGLKSSRPPLSEALLAIPRLGVITRSRITRTTSNPTHRSNGRTKTARSGIEHINGFDVPVPEKEAETGV